MSRGNLDRRECPPLLTPNDGSVPWPMDSNASRNRLPPSQPSHRACRLPARDMHFVPRHLTLAFLLSPSRRRECAPTTGRIKRAHFEMACMGCSDGARRNQWLLTLLEYGAGGGAAVGDSTTCRHKASRYDERLSPAPAIAALTSSPFVDI